MSTRQPMSLALGMILLLLAPCAAPGHIHPSICVTKKGTVVVVHYDENNARVLISRSTDGGKTWSESVPVPGIKPGGTYPGALTALGDGRVVVTWNWYPKGMKDPRLTQFAVSSDDGQTWSEPRSVLLGEMGKSETGVRHALVELSANEWVFPLAQQTVLFNVASGKATPFADGKNHGMVPIVRTPRGTLISGAGRRSVDQGKTWQQVKPFPKMAYHTDMIALTSGLIVAAEDGGADGGQGGRGTCIRLVMSRDDGQSWDFEGGVEIYKTGLPTVAKRTRGGVGNPQLAQLDPDHLGVVFFTHLEPKDAGNVVVAQGERGVKVLFMRIPLKRLEPGGK
jgi:hypothetical protein